MAVELHNIPKHLRGPATINLVVVDARLSFGRLLRVLADAGYSVINNRTGRLVITERPQDFASGAPDEPLQRRSQRG
jgi:hypothetical protein